MTTLDKAESLQGRSEGLGSGCFKFTLPPDPLPGGTVAIALGWRKDSMAILTVQPEMTSSPTLIDKRIMTLVLFPLSFLCAKQAKKKKSQRVNIFLATR